MPVARLVRAQFLSLREKEFVEAARALGATTTRQVVRHILPNALGPVIVAGTIDVAAAIIAESTLSFLGLGFPPDIPTWGRILFDAKDYLDFAPHWALFPGAAIFLAVLIDQLHRRRPARRPRPAQGDVAPDGSAADRHACHALASVLRSAGPRAGRRLLRSRARAARLRTGLGERDGRRLRPAGGERQARALPPPGRRRAARPRFPSRARGPEPRRGRRLPRRGDGRRRPRRGPAGAAAALRRNVLRRLRPRPRRAQARSRAPGRPESA